MVGGTAPLLSMVVIPVAYRLMRLRRSEDIVQLAERAQPQSRHLRIKSSY